MQGAGEFGAVHNHVTRLGLERLEVKLLGYLVEKVLDAGVVNGGGLIKAGAY